MVGLVQLTKNREKNIQQHPTTIKNIATTRDITGSWICSTALATKTAPTGMDWGFFSADLGSEVVIKGLRHWTLCDGKGTWFPQHCSWTKCALNFTRLLEFLVSTLQCLSFKNLQERKAPSLALADTRWDKSSKTDSTDKSIQAVALLNVTQSGNDVLLAPIHHDIIELDFPKSLHRSAEAEWLQVLIGGSRRFAPSHHSQTIEKMKIVKTCQNLWEARGQSKEGMAEWQWQ